MLKRIASVVIAAMLIILSGCTGKTQTGMFNTDKINILCSTFPQYDWVYKLTENSNSIEVSLLLSDGTDIHSFQPSADDIIKISSCDMFIYNGGTSDAALADILSGNKNSNQVVFNMMDYLGEALLPETHIDGGEHTHKDHSEFDEHIWLSLRNAAMLCQAISNEIIKLDFANKDLYTKNAENYIQALNLLDKEYEASIKNAKRHELVFVDRFPFRYLANDYSLTCYAAFPGCSAETDAGFSTILFLADKLDELGLETAICIEDSNVFIADTVREATKSKKLTTVTLNSLQSVTYDDITSGATYLSIMEDNLKALKRALEF